MAYNIDKAGLHLGAGRWGDSPMLDHRTTAFVSGRRCQGVLFKQCVNLLSAETALSISCSAWVLLSRFS